MSSFNGGMLPTSFSWPGLCGGAAILALTCIYLKKFFVNDPDEPAVDYKVPIPEQCQPGWRGEELEEVQLKVRDNFPFPASIGTPSGQKLTQDRQSPGSSAIQCYCPANGRSLGLVNPATPDGINRAVAKASEAQVQWAKTSFGQRRRVLRTLLKYAATGIYYLPTDLPCLSRIREKETDGMGVFGRYILENQEAIATAACLDSGKTRIDASFGEILVTAEKLKWTITHGERALRAERRPTNFLMMYKVNEVRWEPLGVVAACFHNLLGPIISALFSGNAIVVKGSEATAWSSKYFVSIVHGALKACNHSVALVQSVTCWPSAAPTLTSHPTLGHITFIGSRPVAHDVCASAAKALTPVCVELGGKDAAIVLDDVSNLAKVASILMRGVFQSAGQNCIGVERVIACHAVYDRLVALVEPRIRALRLGSALDDDHDVDVGAMISDASFARLETIIAEAVQQGARLLVGGKRFPHPKHPKGHYFSPTLLVDVTPSMRVAREELFAPVFVLMRATAVDDAVQIANNTPYGLGASVFGSSRRDLDKVVAGLKVGMVSVNDFAVYYAVQLPFGGVKGSGYGRFGGEEGLRALCNTKSVCADRWPGVVSTAIPAALDYPIASARRAWEMCQGIVEVGYGETVGRRVRGGWKVVRNG